MEPKDDEVASPGDREIDEGREVIISGEMCHDLAESVAEMV